MGLGAFELVRHHTTFIPRRMPSAFVRQGIFRLSRNPIYLGDALVLAGAILHWDVLPALVLVPAFWRLITRRFIVGEEAGLVERLRRRGGGLVRARCGAGFETRRGKKVAQRAVSVEIRLCFA